MGVLMLQMYWTCPLQDTQLPESPALATTPPSQKLRIERAQQLPLGMCETTPMGACNVIPGVEM